MATHIPDMQAGRLQLYRELKQAAEDQLQGLEQEDMTAFSEATDRRDMIQERISKLDGRVGSAAAGRNEDQRALQAREEVRYVIQQTMEVDRRMVEMATEKRDAAAQDLDRLKAGRKGVRRYGETAPGLPRFVDRQG